MHPWLTRTRALPRTRTRIRTRTRTLARTRARARCIQLAVAISFVLYPVLCGRLLLLFHLSDFGAARVLSSDVRPHTP